MRIRKKYTREMHRQLGYYATWLPGTPLELGDIGVMQGKEFIKIGNVSDGDFQIDFEIEYDTQPNKIDYDSEGGVTVTLKGQNIPVGGSIALQQADVGFNIAFSKKHAIFFEASGTLNHTIANQKKLGDTILELYRQGKWNKDFVVVTELVVADSSTIIISSEKNASAEIKINNPTEANTANLTDQSLGLELVYRKSLHTRIIAESGLTPLFRASKVKDNIFSKPKFEVSTIKDAVIAELKKAPVGNDSTIFADITLDDLDEDM